ncbi:MAG: twin-arginine translocation signal domain-containing protein [Gemmataceae bacterium]
MIRPIGRRDFLRTTAAVTAAAMTGTSSLFGIESKKPKLKKAVKYGMIRIDKGTHLESSNSQRSAGSSASRSTAPARQTSTNS